MKNVDKIWMNYNPKADSLTVYFNGEPIPSVWQDIDEYAYIGFALDDETAVTGLKIEHFDKWKRHIKAPACFPSQP